MALPENLTRAYDVVQQLSFICENEEPSDELAHEFATILNRAIPAIETTEAYALYCFNRTKYKADRRRFLADISGFQPYESMILWTNCEDILDFFKLENRVYLRWDKKLNCFTAKPHEWPTETRVTIPDAKFAFSNDDRDSMEYLDDRDDQMDRLYKRVLMAQVRCQQNPLYHQ